MQGKVCLITGSTNGIGRETARALAAMGAAVVIVGRSAEKSAQVVEQLCTETGNPQVSFLLADLSSQASIRQLAADFRRDHTRLDVLVNNAGGIFSPRRETVDELEYTFALNHLAYFLLTNLLLDLLIASAPSRIVNVTSEAQRVGTINFEDLQHARNYRSMRAYSQSKLANILFTYELARRLAGTGVTVNAVHPGSVATGWGRNNGGMMGLALRLFAPFQRSAAKGAETTVYLAASPDVAGITGQYYADCKPKKSSVESHNLDVARRLWEVSEALTGVSAGTAQAAAPIE